MTLETWCESRRWTHNPNRDSGVARAFLSSEFFDNSSAKKTPRGVQG
ncbi:MAG: hypothetical protein HC933_20265 [Pleurocapsa sp. SU_196_0]|nr:hypothetical protein [Pleurocapsa sp. SU_196_0]